MKKNVAILLMVLFIFLTARSIKGNSLDGNDLIQYYIGTNVETKISYNNETNVEETIDITNYTFYKVDNYLNYTFYVANIINDFEISSEDNIYEIKLIPMNSNYRFRISNIDFNNYNVVEIVSKKNDVLEIIYTPVNTVTYEDITERASLVNMEVENDITEFIKESINYEIYYKSKIYSYNTSTNVNNLVAPAFDIIDGTEGDNRDFANQNHTVIMGDYSEYADYDSSIKTYAEDYTQRLGHYNSDTSEYYSDDGIVRIIPKELFRERGIYSYIGTEYGFYINTYQDVDQDNISNFIVFDIESVKKGYDKNGEILIKPLFTGYTLYYSKYDTVQAYYEGNSKLALTNIQVNLGVVNQDNLNIGDSGYNAYSDYGYVFNSYTLDILGSEKNGENSAGAIATFVNYSAIALEKIFPSIGSFVNICSTVAINLIENSYENSILNQYISIYKDSSGKYRCSKDIINSSDNLDVMIQEHGNLVKGIQICLSRNENNNVVDYNNSLLYKCSGDYFKIEYNFRQRNDSINWNSIISSMITIDIVEDNSIKVLSPNNVTYKDSVTGCWYDSYNLSPGVGTESVDIEKIYMAEYGYGSHQIFEFTPNNSGKYVFETFGSDYDTYITLKRDGTTILEDDNGGTYVNSFSQQKCSKIVYNLMANQKYTIIVKGVNNSGGYCKFIVKEEKADLSLTKKEYTNYSTVSCNGHSIWQKFVPNESKMYTIFTKGNESNLETALEIYDENHNKIAFDDDSGYGLYSEIHMYMEKNEVYYIRTIFYSITANCSTIVIESQIARLPEYNVTKTDYVQDFYLNYLNENPGETVYYKFIPKVTAYYTIELENTGGYQDLVLTVLDKNFNLLASDDDSGGNLLPTLTYNFVSGETYYIQLRQINSAPSNSESFGKIILFKE